MLRACRITFNTERGQTEGRDNARRTWRTIEQVSQTSPNLFGRRKSPLGSPKKLVAEAEITMKPSCE
jgi:hypothetical protein